MFVARTVRSFRSRSAEQLPRRFQRYAGYAWPKIPFIYLLLAQTHRESGANYIDSSDAGAANPNVMAVDLALFNQSL